MAAISVLKTNSCLNLSSPLLLLLQHLGSPTSSSNAKWRLSYPFRRRHSRPLLCVSYFSTLPALESFRKSVLDLVLVSPPTWKSSILSNALIFFAGSPIIASGLSLTGIGVAFLLGVLTWRAFGLPGFILVSAYFLLGTGATKLKFAQKEALGVAEKLGGRRGAGSVIGSGAAGCACAILYIYGVGKPSFWELGFVASFCTKLNDTVSSEIGKAYGKRTYLATTFKVVPRGTEGAISLEGTLAGVLASVVLSSLGFLLGQVDIPQAAVCVLASQIANFFESLIGAALQGKEGFDWLNNDVVNVLNISLGTTLAVIIQQIVLKS